MDGDRGYALVAHIDQWARCRHENTVLADGGGVELDWTDIDRSAAPPECPTEPAGLAFDDDCTAYRSDLRTGTVEALAPLDDTAGDRCGSQFDAPVAVAVDRDGRLYVAERGAGRVAVMDLQARRVLRRVPVRGGLLDVAAHPCVGALALTGHPARLVTLQGRRDAVDGPALRRPRAPGCPSPARLAVAPDGQVLVLWHAPDGEGVVAASDGTIVAGGLWGAVDLDVTADGVLVVALVGPPLLRRYPRVDGGRLELQPLAAVGFDGRAVAVAPGGRIAFTTARGTGRSGGVATRRRTSGRVVTYRLDSGAYRTRWGRLFLDACIPPGTGVQAWFVTTDDDEVGDPMRAQPASRSTRDLRGVTPPLPSESALAAATDGSAAPLFRRPTGRELPWAQIAADDGFETYEVPVAAPRGRYLWIALGLSGTSRTSPRVRELRVERPGHPLLAQLPRSWSRDDDVAAFLQQFLAPAEGMLHELDGQAFHRDLLVDPRVAPQEVLGWLAGFVGLVLDRRWPESARRTLIARAYPLMRRRGTVDALTEMLAIYLRRPPVLVERWRIRGGPGAVLGMRSGNARAVVGGGLRVSGNARSSPAGGADGFALAAHRFCVLVPQNLTVEQRNVVRSVVERHKPAHTTFEISEVGSGMRVGRRLHLGLTAVVGPPGGPGVAVAGSTALGEATVGRAAVGSRLGRGASVKAVRVG